MTHKTIKTALISVSNKNGLLELAQSLQAMDINLISSGGTAKFLRAHHLDVTDVADHTGFPEIMQGRVKTLHPKIHGGILAKRDTASHLADMEANGIPPIDLVVVNLYPFIETMESGASFDDMIENIDIGGPALIRAAAKNHAAVTILTDPKDYSSVISDLTKMAGQTSLALRQKLAAKAFAHTAYYDSVIANWLAQEQGNIFPDTITMPARLKTVCRYGENPHQAAAVYLPTLPPSQKQSGVCSAPQHQGKALSYNNYNDADAAFALVSEFADPSVVIVKHANPCGVASAPSLALAWQKALACDPVSAFGGIIAVNRPLDQTSAEKMNALFLEVIIAPAFDKAALDIFAKRPNLRLIATAGLIANASQIATAELSDPTASMMTMKSLGDGILLQARDNGKIQPHDTRCVTQRQPTDREMQDLMFAWKICKHVKSNAIIYARDYATVGIGAGQMSRVDSAEIAVRKAQKFAGTENAVLASDAFFPFADGLQIAIDNGITAAIQPGGAKRDAEVIAAADAAGIAMLMTDMRHFRH